jgi:hypothetical protein
MSRPRRTSLFQLPVCAGLLLFSLPGVAQAQTGARMDGPGIAAVYVKPLVSVKIDVRALEKPIAIPYCGVRYQNERFLCNARVERLEWGKWVALRPRSSKDVLARIPRRDWKTAIVPPGNLGAFYFTFNPEFFRVSKGDRLRVVVDYWHSKESMAVDETDEKLASPPFDCPY